VRIHTHAQTQHMTPTWAATARTCTEHRSATALDACCRAAANLAAAVAAVAAVAAAAVILVAAVTWCLNSCHYCPLPWSCLKTEVLDEMMRKLG
jgi:hypothetical protein